MSNISHCFPHSYLARFVATGYATNDLIWTYERGLQEIRLCPLKEIQSSYAEVSDSRATEATDATIGKLIVGQSLSPSERNEFSQFLSTQWFRVPLSRASVKADSGGSRIENPIDESHISTFVEMLIGMRWALRTTEESEPLVSSDSPVILNNPTSIEALGPPTPLAYELLFPLCSHAILIATWDGHAGQGLLSGHAARQINRLISSTAANFVYASARIPAIARYLSLPRQELNRPRFPSKPPA
jgi:hypothetical protein